MVQSRSPTPDRRVVYVLCKRFYALRRANNVNNVVSGARWLRIGVHTASRPRIQTLTKFSSPAQKVNSLRKEHQDLNGIEWN